MSETLPGNWAETNLSDVVIYGKGKKPKKLSPKPEKGMIPYINIKAFEQGIIDEYADILSSKLIDSGDILVVWDGARFGLTGMGLEGAAGSTLMVLKPVLCYSKYIYCFINRYYSFINSKPKGTGTPHVNPDVFWNLQFPIAPLNEQKRIVAKLDKIIPRIDLVKVRLDKIPLIIKRFRQSVLTAAVTGKLTEKWREAHPDFIDWLDTSLGEESEYITSGSRGWAEYYSNEGAIFVRTQNINTDKLVLDDVAFVNLPRNAEGSRTKIQKHDILITITGANVTKTALVQTNIEEAYVNQHIALVRLKNSSFSEFIYLWLIAPNAGRFQLEKSAYGAGKPGLNLQNIKDVEIPLPPLEEQQEIVRQVEKLFALADKLESHYQKAKARTDKLSQSVLAKAFRGELVPQDPNDEPAEKLLERIMEEKKKLSQSPQRSLRKKL